MDSRLERRLQFVIKQSSRTINQFLKNKKQSRVLFYNWNSVMPDRRDTGYRKVKNVL